MDRARTSLRSVWPWALLAAALALAALGLNKVFLADGAEGGSVRIDGLIFEASTPSSDEVAPAEFEDAQTPYHKGFLTTLVTDVDIQVGQKAVVGKAATSGVGEGLILVLEAAVLD